MNAHLQFLKEPNRFPRLVAITNTLVFSRYVMSDLRVPVWLEAKVRQAEFSVRPECQFQPRPARILLVEDDPLQQEILSSVCAMQGHEIDTVSDGLSALWKVRQGGFDLVLCDYNLPEINGLAMARLIRDLVSMSARPALIGLTGAPAALMTKEALHGSAFDEIVAKPYSIDKLISIIQRHLDVRTHATARQGCGFSDSSASQTSFATGSEGWGSQEGGSSPPRILVVEDDEVQRSVLTSALETCGFTVKAAADGFQAVRCSRCGGFDLALVDYQLPEMDGLATSRLILNLLQEDSRPRMIAFTSAASHLVGRLRGADGAFDEIVPKSAGLPALLTIVERHLRSSASAATRRSAEVVFPSAA